MVLERVLRLGNSGGIRLFGKFGKLLLSAYVLKKLNSGNSHKVSEPKKNGIMSKYSKLILSAYLMKKLGTGKYSGTREQEGSKGGLLHKFGKLMLTTYAVKKLRSEKVPDETEQSRQYTEKSSIQCSSSSPHTAKKYGKALMGAYLLKRLHHRKPETETTEAVETKTYEESGGPSMIKFSTIVMGAVAGATAIYAIKKYRAKHSEYKIEAE